MQNIYGYSSEDWDKIMEVYDRTQTIMTDAWGRIEAFLHEVNPILIQQSKAFYQSLIDAGIIIKPRNSIAKKKLMRYYRDKKENIH